MAQLNETEQPGATQTPPQDDKDKQLADMQKQLDEKNAQLEAMQKKVDALNLSTPKDNEKDINTSEGPENDDESKMPPKTDVTLSLRGVPEYDQYPYSMTAERFYFMASIKAPYFRDEKRAPIDLVAVVDESSSMQGERIKLVKETVQFIIENLESNDRFGIIGYSNGARTVLPLTKMDGNGKDSAAALANGLRATGCTALCAGLVAGVNMMRNRKSKNDVASVMLLTDGEANEGPTSATEIISALIGGSVLSVKRKELKRKSKKKKLAKKPLASINAIVPPPVFKQNNDAEDEKEGVAKVIDDSDALPCTINTFGFGSGHNESLLESLAESGRGMYAFIEGTDMIADTFAECLGGLVSIVGQDLKIQVDALNDVEINKCLSTGYALTVTKPRKIHTVSIKNLQSEENRDLIFELKMPKVADKREKYPIIQTAVTYKNVVKNVTETLTNICYVNRIDGQQIGERNIELDVQYNRVLAANAMEEADTLATTGNLDAARKVLSKAQDHIKKSKSKSNKFSTVLVQDMQRISDNMRSRQLYQSKGGKMLKMNKKAQSKQRSVQSSMYASQSVYQNSSKGKMKKKFKSKKMSSQ